MPLFILLLDSLPNVMHFSRIINCNYETLINEVSQVRIFLTWKWIIFDTKYIFWILVNSSIRLRLDRSSAPKTTGPNPHFQPRGWVSELCRVSLTGIISLQFGHCLKPLYWSTIFHNIRNCERCYIIFITTTANQLY